MAGHSPAPHARRRYDWLNLWSLAVSLLLVAGAVQSPRSVAAQMSQVRQGFGDLMPSVVEQVLPDYPLEPGRDVNPDSIQIEAVVSNAGRVIHARVVSAAPDQIEFARHAIAALPQWRFRAALDSSGWPVPVLIIIRLAAEPRRASVENPRVSAEVSRLPRTSVPRVDRLQTPSSSDDGQQQRDSTESRDTVSTAPRAIRQVVPRYTPDAMRALIQGIVGLEVLILPNGMIGEARVTTPLHDQLDTEALIAARYWLFEPATLDGRPVASLARLELEFRLH